ncbi:MAG: hypothetical protein U9P72_07575 [Campylobacterota bacterium]|nr:hypothetical protein [Campylobacterota bacterium]
MNRIETIDKSKTINYTDDKIDYFICENNNSSLEDYQDVIGKIKNATKTIQIASTRTLSNKIIDAFYQNDDVNVYIILKSFDEAKATVDRFSDKKPALLREVESLENNFIIIDDKSYFFINPLDRDENISISFDEKQTKDLSFIFNYYFWDCATKEKLVDVISNPIESPFPSIGIRKLEYLNILESDLENCEKIYIPRDKNYIQELDKTSSQKYFSDDIEVVVNQNQEYLQIGSLKINNQTFTVVNSWMLKTSNLNDISINDNIIPKKEEWKNTINLKESKEVEVSSVEAKTIEDMEETEPKEFKKELYIKSITYNWEVTPPSKPSDAKESLLYAQYKKLNNNFQEQLKSLENSLENLKKESGLLTKWFMGTTRLADKNLKEVNKYKQKDLINLSSIDLVNFITKEFKDFYERIIKSNNDFKDEKKKKEAEEKWNNIKEQKNKILKKKKIELQESEKSLLSLKLKTEEKKKLKNEIIPIEKLIKSLKIEKKEFIDEESKVENIKDKLNKIDDKQKEQPKLEKRIKNSKGEIERLNKELEDKYSRFSYSYTTNELNNLKGSENSSQQYQTSKLPKYRLPEVGVLYETNSSYFLEISTFDELDKANELSKRYVDKDNYKVVVGESNE